MTKNIVELFMNNDSNKKYFNIVFYIVIIIVLFSSWFFYNQKIKFLSSSNDKVIVQNNDLNAENKKIQLEKEQLSKQLNDLQKTVAEKEKKPKNEFVNAVYYNREYDIAFKYWQNIVKEKDEEFRNLKNLISEEDNKISFLQLYSKEYQEKSKECLEQDNCYKILDKLYYSGPDAIEIIPYDYTDIRVAISDILKKESKDINNCLLEIKDYQYGKTVELKLAEELKPTEEEVEEWVEQNGDHSGALLNEQVVSGEKTIEYCSRYAKYTPEESYFVYNENRPDVIVYVKLNYAERSPIFDYKSIQFIY